MESGMDQIFSKPLHLKEFGSLLLKMSFINSLPKHLRLDTEEC